MTTMTNNTLAREAERFVLAGVPKLTFEPKPEEEGDVEMTLLPAAISACLRFLGDKVTYTELIGMTGDAFRLSWKEGWAPNNVADIYIAPDPNKTCDLAFAAAGRAYECIGTEPGSVPKEVLRERIIAVLRDKRRPVLAYGVIGPPEMSIITGYDEGGDVLIGRSFFQNMPEFNTGVEFEPSGYFRKRDWYANTWGVVLAGERRDRPPKEARYRQALEWALTVKRTPSVYDLTLNGEAWKDRHNGHAAYDAWAQHLHKDEDFVHADDAALWQRPSSARRRWPCRIAPRSGSKRRRTLREHELMWQVWDQVGGIGRGEKHMRAFAESVVRRRIVPIIHEARDLDVAAALCIEQALAMQKLW